MNFKEYFLETVERQIKFFKRRIQPRVPYFASHLEIELTNHCNLNCPFCYTSHLKREIETLSFGILKKVLEYLKSNELYPRISFCGDGEMFLYPRLIDAIRLAKELGFHASIITNATLCGESKSIALIEAGLDRIQFSVDTVNEYEYEKTRPAKNQKNNFRTVMKNILTFLKHNVECGEPTYVSIMSVQTESNKKSRIEFQEYWQKLPVHNVYFSPVFTLGGVLKEKYKEARTFEFKGNVSKKPICISPFILLCIKSSGAIITCAHDSNAIYRLGKVSEKTPVNLKNIWNGEEIIRLRRALIDGNLEYFVNMGHDCLSCNVPVEGSNIDEYIKGFYSDKLKTLIASMAKKMISGNKKIDALRKELAVYE